MATGILSLTVTGRRAKSLGGPGGVKILTGRMQLCATSAIFTCGIEKYFRSRMDTITLQVGSGYIAQYHPSATHKAGVVYLFGVSNLSANYGTVSGLTRGKAGIINSCCFTATGI